MKARHIKGLLIFFMLWLPLQGMAAAVLSVCVQEKNFTHHQHAPSTVSSDSHHHEGCHKQTAENTINHWLDSLPCDDTSCNAYSNTPILSGSTAPLTAHAISTITPYDSGFTSFVPEQPQRPPLTISL